MRPSQVTYQGRFCYLCAFSASPANWRCIHIYAVGIYICMHVAECAIPRERERNGERRRVRERDRFMLGPCAVILGNSVVVRVVICIVSAEGAAVSLPKKKRKEIPSSRKVVNFDLGTLGWFYYRTPNRSPVLLRLLH